MKLAKKETSRVGQGGPEVCQEDTLRARGGITVAGGVSLSYFYFAQPVLALKAYCMQSSF